jgi:hypothetical protein
MFCLAADREMLHIPNDESSYFHVAATKYLGKYAAPICLPFFDIHMLALLHTCEQNRLANNLNMARIELVQMNLLQCLVGTEQDAILLVV